MAKLKKAISVDTLLNTKFIEIPLTGRFRELIGRPEQSGTWFLKGPSGHGKTTFMLQLVTELTKYGKVLYNSLEEGARLSMQQAVKEQNLTTAQAKQVNFLHRENLDVMRDRLQRSRGIRFVVIDSIQYAFITLKEYKAMQAENPKKVFIINSHVEGKKATGALARTIEYDADIKIDVEGFKAFSRSRASRGKLTTPYVIWQEGADNYWNDLKL
ncbi:ATP-dependent serine protease [Winogradskyella phage Peternella_1]|uniref:ATP-dependent serine protease n=1 Tax=Winogradskyella phage Peternella_1 TaxID=2745699 RepID=A0A8E5EBM7_9CAUD|nr:ATPase [Winogradskyella phage Peternella_1]QQV91541.1 ATP-dependent serine protease [Winogradskyella phage Peternella_1]